MIVQQLMNWEVGLKSVQQQKTESHSGMPMIENGGPLMETMYVLVFTEKGTGNQIHYVFNEETKQEFIRAFTGGVIVPQMSL